MKLKNDVCFSRQLFILPNGAPRKGWHIHLNVELPTDLKVILGGFIFRESWAHLLEMSNGLLLFFDPIIEDEEEVAFVEEIIQLMERHDLRVKLHSENQRPNLESLLEGLLP